MTTTIHAVLSPDAAGAQVSDPRDHLAGDGPGGSRAGYMGLVRAMGRRGDYDVTAFSTFNRPKEVVEGVTYQRLDDKRGLGEADVVLAYYDVRPLLTVPYGPLRIGSHHTLHPYVAWPVIDLNTAPSQWALDFLKRTYRPLSRWELLPNAVEGLDHVKWQPVPGRVIYQTSPDRGLHVLLGLWPEIIRRVPHATLHVTGTPEAMVRGYGDPMFRGSDEARMAQQLADGMLAAQKAGGVEFLGRVTKKRMLEELSQASVAAYPFELWSPSETFSISVLESHVIGVPVVMAPADALGDIWGRSGCIVTPDPVRHHKPEFVDAVVQALTDNALAKSVSEVQRTFSSQFTFDKAAEALDAMVRKHRVAA
jgi:glycosyltransferase involved in cell wall biosynthesis